MFNIELREYFEVRFRAEKYGVPYFLAESEAKQSDPRREAAGARAPKAFGGRGFKCTGYPQLFMGCNGEPEKLAV